MKFWCSIDSLGVEREVKLKNNCLYNLIYSTAFNLPIQMGIKQNYLRNTKFQNSRPNPISCSQVHKINTPGYQISKVPKSQILSQSLMSILLSHPISLRPPRPPSLLPLRSSMSISNTALPSRTVRLMLTPPLLVLSIQIRALILRGARLIVEVVAVLVVLGCFLLLAGGFGGHGLFGWVDFGAA